MRPGQRIEAVQGMHFAMPQRIVNLVVGPGDHQGQIGFAQDRRAKDLVSGGHTGFGQRQDVVLDDIEQAGGKGVGCDGRS